MATRLLCSTDYRDCWGDYMGNLEIPFSLPGGIWVKMGGFDSVEDARAVRAEFKAAMRKSKKLRKIFGKYEGVEETEDEENAVEAPAVKEQICKVCGKRFVVNKYKKKYCSDKCRSEAEQAYIA